MLRQDAAAHSRRLKLIHVGAQLELTVLYALERQVGGEAVTHEASRLGGSSDVEVCRIHAALVANLSDEVSHLEAWLEHEGWSVTALEEGATPADAEPIDADDLQGAVWAQLKNVYDPEIPVNIVDLGLIYDCQLNEEADGTIVDVKMTLTAPGCGMGPTIAADAQSRIMTLDAIKEAKVELVWDPPWNQDMISEEGKMKLGMI